MLFLFVVSVRIEDRDGETWVWVWEAGSNVKIPQKMRHLPHRIFKAIGGGKDLLF